MGELLDGLAGQRLSSLEGAYRLPGSGMIFRLKRKVLKLCHTTQVSVIELAFARRGHWINLFDCSGPFR